MLANAYSGDAPSRNTSHATSPARPRHSAAKHERACHVVPFSRNSSGPSANRPALQPAIVSTVPTTMPGGPSERTEQRRHLPAEQADAHRQVAPAREFRQSHPARKRRQQETEEETRQHLVLHDEGMQPARVGSRLRHREPLPARRRQPRRPPRHRQQHVAGADEEHQPVRRPREQARGERAGGIAGSVHSVSVPQRLRGRLDPGQPLQFSHSRSVAQKRERGSRGHPVASPWVA